MKWIQFLRKVIWKFNSVLAPLSIIFSFVFLWNFIKMDLIFFSFFFSFQYRTIEAERLNFIELRKKSARKYNKVLNILDKEKSDLQYKLDSEQKGIHARRDSDVCSIVILSRLTYILVCLCMLLCSVTIIQTALVISFSWAYGIKWSEYAFILSMGSLSRLIEERSERGVCFCATKTPIQTNDF